MSSTFAKRGFAPILLLIVGVLVAAAGIVGGSIYIKNNDPDLVKKVSKSDPVTPNPELTSTPSSNPTSSVQIPADWKTLEVKSCAINLKHPPDWKSETFEEGKSCQVIIHPIYQEAAITFNLSTNPRSDYPSLEMTRNEFYKNPQTKDLKIEDIMIDSSPGIFTQSSPDKVSDSFLIKRGGVMFIGSIIIRGLANNQTTHQITRNIVNSIRFTAPEDKYQSDPNDQFQEHLIKNAIYRSVASSLKSAAENYKIEKGKLPDSLDQLNDGHYLSSWEKSEFHDLSKYTYTKKGDKFSISVKLSNGSDYVVSSD